MAVTDSSPALYVYKDSIDADYATGTNRVGSFSHWAGHIDVRLVTRALRPDWWAVRLLV